MPSAIIRRGVWAIGAVILGVALFLMVLPLIASTQIVRERVALEMSAWSGYRVELGSAPCSTSFPCSGRPSTTSRCRTGAIRTSRR